MHWKKQRIKGLRGINGQRNIPQGVKLSQGSGGNSLGDFFMGKDLAWLIMDFGVGILVLRSTIGNNKVYPLSYLIRLFSD